MNRPPIDETFMAIAMLWSYRSTCPRGQVGCVIVSEDNNVLTSGFNGAPRGTPHCIDVGCLIAEGHCISAIHAEMNAIIFAAYQGIELKGSKIFTTTRPCLRCLNALIQAGIKEIVFMHPYPGDDFMMFVSLCGTASITFRKMDWSPEMGEMQ